MPAPSSARIVEDILGCKWSLCVLDMIEQGRTRPGEIRRGVAGLSAKVLNERLRKLLRFGILERKVFVEVPPRVEYRLTPLGRRFNRILAAIRALDQDIGRRAG